MEPCRGAWLGAAGRGNAIEAYVATVAEVHVNTSTGAIRVTRVVVAHDGGLIINPDGLRHQIEGNVIQSISRTLKEQVNYTAGRVSQNGWQDFPAFFVRGDEVIGFDEVPAIEIVLIDRPDQPPWGAGEPVIGTLPCAIGNAVAQAVGRRVRRLPMTGAEVLASPPA